MSAPPSVEILRTRGAMSLRELTRHTAEVVLMYEDVDAVLRGAEARGEVQVVEESEDYRNTVWRAV